MDGYDDTSYGKGFADVYDDWYADVSDVDATVSMLADIADGGAILELGVGTGRLAIPLADRAPTSRIVGIDTSTEMLARLRSRHPTGIEVINGDMVDDLPDGPFAVVFAAYNTLFNLLTAERQQACFRSVAERLEPGGRFVIEAFVPDDPPRDGDHVDVRHLAADRVVLSVSRHDGPGQRADGQFVEFGEGTGIRLRPWSIRYSTVGQLDSMAARVGLGVEQRWESFDRTPWTPDSSRHVTVYRPGT